MTVAALLVAKNSTFLETAREAFQREGIRVHHSRTSESAFELTSSTHFDVVIIQLSPADGLTFELSRKIRERSLTPIIILSDASSLSEELQAFSAGATDYVSLPSNVLAITARLVTHATHTAGLVQAWSAKEDARLSAGPITIDVYARQVTVNGVEVELTRTEFDLLAVLVSRPQHVVTRREILDRVWDSHWDSDDHALDTHVSRLRTKISRSGGPRVAHAVRGVGYRLFESGNNALNIDNYEI
jgi:DNA-binding response OmpR family regulator